MYRILIIDDNREFIGVEADEIVHVEHSWDAVAELRAGQFAEVWLDYDLVGDDKGSGTSLDSFETTLTTSTTPRHSSIFTLSTRSDGRA